MPGGRHFQRTTALETAKQRVTIALKEKMINESHEHRQDGAIARGGSRMPSSTSKGRGGLDTVELAHASGATATVYLWGATLTSYCTAQREEMIFVSPGAVFDGTQPIRGGVPVVFPQFGRPDQRLPMHGLARTSMWSVDSIVDATEETRAPPSPRLSTPSLPDAPRPPPHPPPLRDPGLLLSLSESAATLELWPHRFRLELTVRLSG